MSKNGVSEEDKALFRKAVQSVKPLKKTKQVVASLKPRPQTLSKFTERENKTMTESILHLSSSFSESVDAQSSLSFCRQNIPTKRLRELKQGEIPWEARLDLHGLRPETAEHTLVNFIMEKTATHHRCLLIIHGKGSLRGEAPVLKNLVNHWLRQIPQVLAFHSALPREGGTGALYVLLKRNRDT